MAVTILGPTATGKTQLAVSVARLINGEIISADSRQVYKELTIGAGKDLEEYGTGSDAVPYHLIDICTLDTEYNLYLFLNDFYRVYNDIVSRGKVPVICGGTGLYLSGILQKYSLTPVSKESPEYTELLQHSHEELKKRLLKFTTGKNLIPDLETKERTAMALLIMGSRQNAAELPDIPFTIFALMPPVEHRRANIRARLTARLNNGMIEETKNLLAQGIPPARLDMLGLEYRYLTRYLQGSISYDEMDYRLFVAICDFSKRQMTWFRKMIKEGTVMKQITTTGKDERLTEIMNVLNI